MGLPSWLESESLWRYSARFPWASRAEACLWEVAFGLDWLQTRRRPGALTLARPWQWAPELTLARERLWAPAYPIQSDLVEAVWAMASTCLWAWAYPMRSLTTEPAWGMASRSPWAPAYRWQAARRSGQRGQFAVSCLSPSASPLRRRD